MTCLKRSPCKSVMLHLLTRNV